MLSVTFTKDSVKIDRAKANELEKFFADASGSRGVEIITDNDENLVNIELHESWEPDDVILFTSKLQACIISGIVDLYFDDEYGNRNWIRVFPRDLEKSFHFQQEWVYMGSIWMDEL